MTRTSPDSPTERKRKHKKDKHKKKRDHSASPKRSNLGAHVKIEPNSDSDSPGPSRRANKDHSHVKHEPGPARGKSGYDHQFDRERPSHGRRPWSPTWPGERDAPRGRRRDSGSPRPADRDNRGDRSRDRSSTAGWDRSTTASYGSGRSDGRVDRTSQEDWGRRGDQAQGHGDRPQPQPPEKKKPTLELSGALVADTNTVNGVVIKYNEPPEARKPRIRWRLYPFRGDEALPVLYVHRQSGYLIGRDPICDISVAHPSTSKQHAVLQYRLVPHQRSDGSVGKMVKPYVIDLKSANGTYLNNQRIEAQRYVELRERDVLKFGYSSREYVLLNENSEDAGQSDEEEPLVKEEPE